uniref:Predicted protein n=1 Tax=Hordeum vulgare subsp. vulgare TaxID=112509 RepID=F2E9F9_HORVV|nr:predicted protein [Hordeum vulgare subsp. vulgare]
MEALFNAAHKAMCCWVALPSPLVPTISDWSTPA